MNFPDNLLFQLLYALINTPGLGGIAVGLLAVAILIVVVLMLRWISHGAQADEVEEYAYPTPALHHAE
jgi:hypothetical protein